MSEHTAIEIHSDVPDYVVHPLTQEALDLATAPDEHLARFLTDVREYESLLREAKAIVSREVVRRMDEAVKNGVSDSWTLRVGPWKVSAPSPAPSVQFDGKGLYQTLLKLAQEGEIGPDAVDRAVETDTTYKVNRGILGKLSKAFPAVKAAAEAHRIETDKDRSVKVERA